MSAARVSRESVRLETWYRDLRFPRHWCFSVVPNYCLMFYVYILYSEKLDSYYAGSTSDLADRIRRHNSGQSNYTRKGVPWEIVYVKTVTSRSLAVKLERKIKKRGIRRFLDDQR